MQLYPRAALNKADMKKRLFFNDLIPQKINFICDWKQNDDKGKKKKSYIKSIIKENDNILVITEKDAKEILDTYQDTFPCLALRKFVWRIFVIFRDVTAAFISTKVFENSCILVIMLNCFAMMADDPTALVKPEIFDLTDNIFLAAYTFEMASKIIGLGFFLGENAYLRDPWNMLDCLIVGSAYVTLFTAVPIEYSGSQEVGDQQVSSSFDLKALRVFRVLRPLKTISSIKGLKVLVSALFAAVPLLRDTIFILFCYFLVFAITGEQLLTGLLKNRCVNQQTGNYHQSNMICGQAKCPDGYFCGKTNQNPHYGLLNFDNVMYALMAVFQSVTLQGWSEQEVEILRAYSDFMILYFVPLVYIGSFFFLNLTLAVINSKFTESNNLQKSETKESQKKLLTNDVEVEKVLLNNLKYEININGNFHLRKVALQMIKFLRIKQAEKTKTIQPKTAIVLENKEEIKSILGAQKSENRQGEKEPKTVVFQDEAEQIDSNDLQLKRAINSDNKLHEVEEKEEEYLSDQEKKDKDQIKEASLGGDQQVFKEESKNQLEKKPVKVLKLTNHKINLMKTQAIYSNIQMISPSHDLINNQNYENQDFKMKLKMKGNEGFTRQILAKKKFQEDEKKQIKIQNIESNSDKNLKIKSLLPQSVLTEEFVNNELNFDKIIPMNFRPLKQEINLTDKEQEQILIFDDKFQIKQKDDKLLNFSDIDEQSGRIIKGTDGDIQEKSFQISEHKNSEEISNSIKSIGNNRTIKSQFPNEKIQINTPRSAQTTATQIKDNIKEKFLNAAFFKTDQDNESDASILQSFRQTQDNSKEVSQGTQQQFQNQKMKEFNVQTKHRASLFIKNTPFVTQCPQNLSKAYRNIIQTQFSLSKRSYDNYYNIIRNDEENEQPQVDLLFKVDQGEEELNYHIENKVKAKTSWFKNKTKNADKIDSQFSFCFDLKKKTKNGEDLFVNKKLEEKIQTDKPEDVFALMDKQIQKCMIMPSTDYKSFSQQELTEERITASQVLSEFVQHQQEPEPLSYQEFVPELQKRSNNYLPFQQKVIYAALEDSSELEDYVTSSEEEYWRELQQPYQTLQNVAYFEQLKQLPLKEITRRSDIVATSTFCSSVFPMDKRKMSKVCRVQLDNQQIVQYQDERNKFKALCQEQKNHDKILRDKDKSYNDNYIRSFIQKTEFSSKTLKEFKEICQKLNCNQNEVVYKSQQELFDIQIRFQQNLRASEKRGVPRMTYEVAQQIVNGQYHDQDDIEEQNAEKLGKISDFQKELDSLTQNKNDKKQESEIPKELRLEFDIPEDMDGMELNFVAIKRVDFDRKKNKHLWSGQDVMPGRLNYSLSLFIVDKINLIRAWPRGFQGVVKRGRILARLIIFSAPFDALFTFLVIVNTVILSLNFYGISYEMSQVLAYINDQLTKLFIIELAFKLMGLGPIKYVEDRMHILDATIVAISIFEMVYSAIFPGGANFKAFSTLRMLRTFRVIRLVRLLKGMQGMQVIIAVIGRSYQSTLYISILLLVFMFIFALLGMQFFGGKLNYQEGLPQNNFDNFAKAGIAVFCVLTKENWSDIFFDTAKGDLNKFMVAVFFVAWIFIGNFIILNLFISVLLDSYLEENDEQDDKLSKEKALEIKQQRKLCKKQLRQRKIVLMIKNSKVQTKVKEEDEPEEIEDLDEDEIVKIFKNQGFMQKDEIEEQKVELFIGVECKSSFFLFKMENPFRILCYKMVNHKLWDRWVMTLIFLSSIKLALDTYLPAVETHPIVVASFYIDYFLNFSFILEMITKQIAIGFIMDKGSYLSESWNCLDFFIVLSSIADMSLSFLNIKFVKILRLLRTLRPLRVISNNVALKMIVVALLDSIANIFNVLLIVLVVWLMFGIMGVNFFGGKFSYCSVDMYKLLTKLECEIVGGLWTTYHQNFDNAFQAVSTLFIVSTLEGWVQVMFQAIDSYDTDRGPQKNASSIYALYFIGFVIVGSFFFLNFFIGVLFLRYTQAQKQELEGFSKKDIAWLDIQKLILESEPEYETINVPESPFRLKFYNLVCSSKFENTIMAVICINMLSMAIQLENQTALQTYIIGNSNYAFTAIFIVEGFLKFVAFGFSYFDNGWNRFDFFVICAGILDILIQFLGSAIQWLSFAPQVSRIFRIIRLTRIVKLFGKAQGLQALVQTMIFSVSSFSNVVMLLTLVYFMFAILGVFLFSEVTQGDIVNEYKNFSAFWPSLFTLLAVSTGENWNILLYDLSKTPPNCIERATCGSIFSLPYFFSLIILLQWVMFNLFILVVIEQFEKYYLPKENIIKIFKNDYVIFMDVWKQFTMQRYKCLKIKENQLIGFFHRLGDKDDSESSLGFSRLVYDEGDVKKFLLKMSIRSTDGFICFNELLYRAMRRKYGNFKIGKKMQISEYQTQYSIYYKMAEQSDYLDTMLENDEIEKNLIKKENGINPFLISMSYRLSFRTWFKISKARLKKKAVLLLTKCGNIDMLDKDKLEDPPQKFTNVDICQENYFSFTSEDENFTEMSLGKSLISSSKKQKSKTSHLQKFEKAMVVRIKNSIKKDNPLFPFLQGRIQQNID